MGEPVGAAFHALGEVYLAADDGKQAEQCFRKSLKATDNPSLLCIGRASLGRALILLRRHTEARDLLSAALREQREHLGPRHIEVSNTLHALGDTYEALGRRKDARAAFREAYEIALERHGPKHTSTLDSQVHWAEMEIRMGAIDAGLARLAIATTHETRPYERGLLKIRAGQLAYQHRCDVGGLAEVTEGLQTIAAIGPEFRKQAEALGAQLWQKLDDAGRGILIEATREAMRR